LELELLGGPFSPGLCFGKRVVSYDTREKIVYVRTEDGLTLEGLMIEPARKAAPLETILWFHGVHRKFSEIEYVEIGRLLAGRGYRFITANMRGHDFGTWFRTEKGAFLGGSAWELFSQSPIDVAAWVEFATRDCAEILLAGHGVGGSKIVYYQSERRDPRIMGLVLASSASLFREKMRQDLQAEAEKMIMEGHEKELLPWGTRNSRQAATISAEAYVDLNRVHEVLYGFGNIPPALSRIACPILAWYGTKEKLVNKDIDDFLSRVRHTATSSQLVVTKKLVGVDYFYTGSEKAVAGQIARWITKLRDFAQQRE
jgi:pimeloyl-ACP methyl ester carboxylesterase